ncbi:hypothetical protein, partial [Kaarinaea lacus]
MTREAGDDSQSNAGFHTRDANNGHNTRRTDQTPILDRQHRKMHATEGHARQRLVSLYRRRQ